MLIADDVGIGKTIEAALVARELLDRGEINRMAVVCPPYLCDQWQRELSEKFSIEAKIVRTNTLARLERDLPRPNLSVFEYYPHLIVSIDYVKAQTRRDAFLLHCPDLVIVDEAHGCARPSGQSVSQQLRHQLVHDLSKLDSKHLLLVTATPHSGIEESFLSLLGLLQPSFARMNVAEPSENELSSLVKQFVQRRRADVQTWMGTETSFPERIPDDHSYKLSSDYDKLFKDIYRFCRESVITDESQSGVRRRVRYWAALALLRCVMSSPAAAQAAMSSRLGSEDVLDEEDDSSIYVLDPTDSENVVDVAPTHLVGKGELTFSDSEKKRLRDFKKRAAELVGDKDTKLKKAEILISGLLNEGFSPIIFCRFIATAEYVAEELAKRLSRQHQNLRVVSATGALSEEERQIRVNELSKFVGKRVLVATDCLSEGLSLQGGFNAVLHYDLPWNPNRLEQREGRVDRFGQSSPTVKTILLYGQDNPIDGAVLQVLLRKARQIHKTLGITVPIPVDSEGVMETLLHSLFHKQPETEQLSLFQDDDSLNKLNREWDRAVNREKTSRTRFAQRAIKPAEIAQELEITDSVLGNPQVVENFVNEFCHRLGSPISKTGKAYNIEIERLPETVKAKLFDQKIDKIGFDVPCPAATYISRTHPLTSAMAEYILDEALNNNGNRNLAARCGVIRSKDVEKITTLLLMRLRFLVKTGGSENPSLAEESFIAGFTGAFGTETWLPKNEAQRLFESVSPSANVSESDKRHWGETILKDFDQIITKTRPKIDERAEELRSSYERLRKAIKGHRINVEPLFPPDVLSVSVVLPQPRT
jgi:hypothetical protein